MTAIKYSRKGILCIGIAFLVGVTGCTSNTTKEAEAQTNEPVIIETNQSESTKRLSIKSEKIKEETDAYIVEVEIPIITGFEDQVFQESVNETINESASNYVESIKAMAIDIQDEGYLTSPYYAGIAYDILNNDENYLVIEINYNEYTGGAHGNYFSEVINYDVKAETVLTLQDIVDTSQPYMEALNRVVTEAIESARTTSPYGDDLHSWYEGVEEGTLSFSIQAEGLGIHFQPYEIGPYAEGAPSFIIPYDKLSDVLILNK